MPKNLVIFVAVTAVMAASGCYNKSSGQKTAAAKNAGAAPVTAMPAGPKPLLAWLFDDGTGKTVSGRDGNGHITGSAAWVDGIRGKAVDCGRSGYVDFGTIPGDGLGTRSALSVSLWVKINNTLPVSGLYSMGGAADTDGKDVFSVFLNGNVLGYGVRTGSEWIEGAVPDQPLRNGKWYHLVFAWDGTGVIAYIDGKGVGTIPCAGPIDFAGQKTAAGARNGGGPEGIADAVIDELAIYDRALTAGEVKTIYTSYPSLSAGE